MQAELRVKRKAEQPGASEAAETIRGARGHQLQRSAASDGVCGIGFLGVVEGKYDDIPEQAFYMKGTIDEVLETAEKMKGAAA